MSRSTSLILVGVAAAACGAVSGCADSGIRAVREFNEAADRGDVVTARAYMAPGARVWYENPAGPGEPWTLGEGSYSEWDKEFRTRKHVIDGYQRDGDSVWVVVSETNDYYRLTERPWSRTYLEWRLDEHNRIRGLMVAEVGEPTSRSKEFREWARANEPAEAEYLMPGNRLDTTGDRAKRMRALLERWRAAVGLPPIEREGEK